MDWNGKRKALTFSYDDDVEQDVRLLQIFEKHGMRCTWNLNSGLMEPDSHFFIGERRINRLTMQQAKSLYLDQEIAVHTCTHPDPTAISDEQLVREIADDKRGLEQAFECEITGMAYPFGKYSDHVVEIVRSCGIRYARTVVSTHSFALPEDPFRLGATCHHNDEALFDLARAFLEAKPEIPMLFYIWGHSYEFDVDDNWDRIEALCQLLGGREDIAYLTNAQALL